MSENQSADRWIKGLLVALIATGIFGAGLSIGVTRGEQKGLDLVDAAWQRGLDEGQDIGTRRRMIECNESFNTLQANGILIDDAKSSWRRNWDYIQTLLCDGAQAGEAQ